jgi:hypothetical protein
MESHPRTVDVRDRRAWSRSTCHSGNIRVVSIFEFDDDRLVCEKAFMDVATMLTQVGMLPQVG